MKKHGGSGTRSGKTGSMDLVSRRGFLASSAGLALAAVGCGGSSVSPLEKKASYEAMWERLLSGFWNKPPSEKAAERIKAAEERKKAQAIIEKASKATKPEHIAMLKELGILQ